MIYIKLYTIYTKFIICMCTGQLHEKLFPSKAVQITRFDSRCSGANVPMTFLAKDIKCNTKKVFVSSLKVKVTEDLGSNLKGSAVIYRCKSRENLDTCEEYYKANNLNYCQIINPDNVMANQSPLAVQYTPKFKCPIKKGTYNAYNSTINLEPLIFFNVDGWYWKLETRLFPPTGNRLLSCTLLEGYVSAKPPIEF